MDISKNNSSNSGRREDEFQDSDRDAAHLLGASDAEEVIDHLLNGYPERPTRAQVAYASRNGGKTDSGDPTVFDKSIQRAKIVATVAAPTGGSAPGRISDPCRTVDVEEYVMAETTTSNTTPTTAGLTSTPARLHAGGPYFSSGLFACCENCGVCLEACCCAYCMAGSHHNFFRSNRAGMSCCICSLLWCADAALSFVWLSTLGLAPPTALMCHTCCMRHALRQRYHLEKEEQVCVVEDLCAVCFCLPCVLAQHQREIAAHGNWCTTVCCSQTSFRIPGSVDLV